jgi:hypothetical protein
MQPLLLWKSNKNYTFREYVFIDLSLQHSMRVRHIFISGLPRSTKVFHSIL